MKGAQALFRALVEGGIDTCFANPGTTEMWLVYEMGRTEDIRPVLCLHENVVTGSADGYGRMTGRPALSLLHVACGLSNGLANLHNAARAHTPMVNLVGGNASYHLHNDPELEFIGSRILELACSSSHWARESESADELALLATRAIRESLSGAGQTCTIVVPCNHMWEECAGHWTPAERISPRPVDPRALEAATCALGNGEPTALILGSHALQEEALETAGCIAAATGATILGETFVASRHARGEGRVPVRLVPYGLEQALPMLSGLRQAILVGASPPVSTMAYRGKPLHKLPPEARTITLAGTEQDLLAALQELAAAVNAPEQPQCRQPRENFPRPTGELTATAIGKTISIASPDDFILVDEGVTVSSEVVACTRGARRHDYLFAPAGAAIGAGLPVALGAAVACPKRKVVCLQADGSAMYTPMTLWSMAREKSDVTVVLLKNDSYGILKIELARVLSEEANARMNSLLELNDPTLDWVHIARGHGVPASRARTAEEFFLRYSEAMAEPGPHLIEADLKQDLGPAIELIRKAR